MSPNAGERDSILDADIRNTLADASEIISHAKIHLLGRKVARIDRRLAVRDAHQAVESVLRARAKLIGQNPYDLPSTIKTLKKNGVVIPYAREIDELIKARELVQHYATVPDERDVYRLVRAAENFLIDFSTAAFQIEFDNAARFELIANPEIKDDLKNARKELAAGNFEDAAILAHLAIQRAKWLIEAKIRPTSVPDNLWLRLGRTGQREVDRSFETVGQALDYVLDLSLAASFATELNTLQKITRSVFFRSGDEVIKQVLKEFREHETITQEDAEFALELALQFTQWADEVYGLEGREPESVQASALTTQ